MSEKFLIQGGKPLRGTVSVRGAKNAALALLAATLLTKKPCVIRNMPLIEDVFKMIRILEKLGAKVEWLEERTVRISCIFIDPAKLDNDLVQHFRGSILVLGSLLGRFGDVTVSQPGGCLIGARPIDTHLDAFVQLGVSISSTDHSYRLKKSSNSKKDGSQSVVLREFSVTATVNVLLFCALKEEQTTIQIADQDYQVQELARALKQMGVQTRGVGTHTFQAVGKKVLKGFDISLISDPIETGTFMVASLATKGEVTITNAEVSYLTLFLKRLTDFGAKFELVNRKTIKIFPSPKLKIDKVQSLPYPGIHTDLQPELGVLATQAKGPTLIHDPLYEGRLKYLEELNRMGADIIFCDPHRAIVNGPMILYGIEIPSLDLRAGAALVIAGLVARGQTTINNVYQIDRGYEKLEERFAQLGADIKRVPA